MCRSGWEGPKVDEVKAFTILLAITMVIGLFLAFWISTNPQEIPQTFNTTANCTCIPLRCDCKLDFNERDIPKELVCHPYHE